MLQQSKGNTINTKAYGVPQVNLDDATFNSTTEYDITSDKIDMPDGFVPVAIDVIAGETKFLAVLSGVDDDGYLEYIGGGISLYLTEWDWTKA